MMKRQVAIFSTIFVTLTLAFGINAIAGETLPTETAITYEHLLDQYIAKCNSKIEMKNSGLENIRHAAAIAALKGTFAKTYKKELIGAMIQDEINPKPYKVHVYLNDRFYSLIREKNSEL